MFCNVFCFGFGFLLHDGKSCHYIFQSCFIFEKIIILEYHGTVLPEFMDILLGVMGGVYSRIAYGYQALCGNFKEIGAS